VVSKVRRAGWVEGGVCRHSNRITYWRESGR
jgi:hypothetical protein